MGKLSENGIFISAAAWGKTPSRNRNHIGASDDKWRRWIIALLISYLEVENFYFTVMFEFLVDLISSCDYFDLDHLQFQEESLELFVIFDRGNAVRDKNEMFYALSVV